MFLNAKIRNAVRTVVVVLAANVRTVPYVLKIKNAANPIAPERLVGMTVAAVRAANVRTVLFVEPIFNVTKAHVSKLVLKGVVREMW